MDKKQQRQAERQAAINEYKQIRSQLDRIRHDGDTLELQNFLAQVIQKMSGLYKVVKKNIEGTGHDAKILRDISEICEEASKKVNRASRILDLRAAISRRMRELEIEKPKAFMELIVQEQVKTSLCTPPSREFLYGTFGIQEFVPRQRAQRVLREKEADKAATSSKQKNMVSDAQSDSTPQEVEHLFAKIENAHRRAPEAMYFDTLVDTESFSKTVENIFHASFLVKESKIGIKRDNSDLPVIYQPDTEEDNGKGFQSVMTFSMKDYKKWVQSIQ